jgi:hypothetical protein
MMEFFHNITSGILAAPPARVKTILTGSRMGYLFIMLIPLLFIAPTACNPEEWEFVDCSECLTAKPAEAAINVKVSISNLNPSVIVNVYRGDSRKKS